MPAVRGHDLELPDGRNLHYYVTHAEDGPEPELAVFWLHGSPSFGEPPVPLFDAATAHELWDGPGWSGAGAQVSAESVWRRTASNSPE